MASRDAIRRLFNPDRLNDRIWQPPGLLVVASVVLVLTGAGCRTKDPRSLNLMPAPEVFADGTLDPFGTAATQEPVSFPVETIFYATDRRPVTNRNTRPDYYGTERGYLLRLGVAHVGLGKLNMTWAEARKISLLKNRPGNFPLRVSGVEEYGILNDTLTMFDDPTVTPNDPAPAAQYAAAINQKLAASRKKDVVIYVPGFKVVFENPVLVASELWHFLGFDGAFIAYSWPATPKNTAYFGDIETAAYSARNFRIFLEYLARNTDAEQIHIIGYSAGTRVVLSALEQLTFLHHDQTHEEIQQQLRIGHVFILGSDVDRERAAAYLVDGILKVPQTLNVYQSSQDKALGMSKWIHNRERVGQIGTNPIDSPLAAQYLRDTKNLSVINVSEAEGSTTGNGHGYFRKSPWVSSDVLMTIYYDLTPEERGLVRAEDSHVWSFPPDYIQHLRATLKEKLRSGANHSS